MPSKHKALSSKPSTAKKNKRKESQVWCMLVIPVLGKLRQKDCKFKASLGYIVHSKPN
jgi:hypothetical protein